MVSFSFVDLSEIDSYMAWLIVKLCMLQKRPTLVKITAALRKNKLAMCRYILGQE